MAHSGLGFLCGGVEHIILSWRDGHTAQFASRFSTRSSHVQKRVEGFLFVSLFLCLS